MNHLLCDVPKFSIFKNPHIREVSKMQIKMTKIFLTLIFLVFFLSISAYSAEWYENYDDTNDFDPPTPGSPGPYSRPNPGTYFTDYLDGGPASQAGGGKFYVWHEDRAGHGKCLKVYSPHDPWGGGPGVNREIIPGLHKLDSDTGKRWKFDLWIGPSIGTYKHTANALKFIYYGQDVNHTIYLGRSSISGNYYTNLSTGEQGTLATLSPNNLHLRVMDNSTWDQNVGYTDLNNFREQWITVEIEIDCGNPASVKIWINNVLDFYRIFNGQNFHSCSGQILFTNVSGSCGGDFYLGIDNFHKYDSLKTPPEAPTNLRIVTE